MDEHEENLRPVLIGGEWRASKNPDGDFRASNPATGEAIDPSFPISGADDIEAALAAAVNASHALAATDPERIATFLEHYADGIEAAAEQLVAIAHEETALPAPTRLAGNELPRTTGQLRQAAAAVRSRAWTQCRDRQSASIASGDQPIAGADRTSRRARRRPASGKRAIAI